MTTHGYGKYLWTLAIALIIFLGITSASNYFDARRLNEIRSVESGIALNILSSETEFALLGETPCENLGNSSLTSELDSLGSRLSYLENTRGITDSEVVQLKQEYSLLEIKDYILMDTMAQKCHTKPTYILYFYSNTDDCRDCQNAGAVLTELRQEYPLVRVYSFDYHTPIAAVKTLTDIFKVKEQFPALVIHNKPVYGLKSLTDIEKLMPELATIGTSTATSSVTGAKK